jgi:hypothetical protein
MLQVSHSAERGFGPVCQASRQQQLDDFRFTLKNPKIKTSKKRRPRMKFVDLISTPFF